MARGDQLFCCAPISSNIYPYVAFEVTKTFGGLQTYMNRILMFSDEIVLSPAPVVAQETDESVEGDLRQLSMTESLGFSTSSASEKSPRVITGETAAPKRVTHAALDRTDLLQNSLDSVKLSKAGIQLGQNSACPGASGHEGSKFGDHEGNRREKPVEFSPRKFAGLSPKKESKMSARRLNRALNFEDMQNSRDDIILQRIDDLEGKLSTLVQQNEAPFSQSIFSSGRNVARFDKILDHPSRTSHLDHSNKSNDSTATIELIDTNRSAKITGASNSTSVYDLEKAVHAVKNVVKEVIKKMNIGCERRDGVGRTVPRLRSVTHHPPRSIYLDEQPHSKAKHIVSKRRLPNFDKMAMEE